MVLKLWVMLLILPVVPRAEITSHEEQKKLKSTRYTLIHLDNGHLAYKVTDKKPDIEVVTEELPNWQADPVQQKLDMLKSGLEPERYQKCLNLLNPISSSSSTNPQLNAGDKLKRNLDFKLCILREQWQQSIDDTGLSNLKTRRALPDALTMFNFTRSIEPGSNNYKDCLYNVRNYSRPFPGDCYTKNYAKLGYKEFWPFWGEIAGDFMYIFDYVLYNRDKPFMVQYQFWWLLAYLRVIVLEIENPHDIVNYFLNVTHNEQHRFNKLVDRFNIAVERLFVLTNLFVAKIDAG